MSSLTIALNQLPNNFVILVGGGKLKGKLYNSPNKTSKGTRDE
jgi:hypothetical protein